MMNRKQSALANKLAGLAAVPGTQAFINLVNARILLGVSRAESIIGHTYTAKKFYNQASRLAATLC